MLAKHSQFKDAEYLRVVRQRERLDPFRGIGSAGINPVGSIDPAVSLSAKPHCPLVLINNLTGRFCPPRGIVPRESGSRALTGAP